MITLDFTDTELKNLITHRVGNKSRGEDIIISAEPSVVSGETREHLMKYFLYPFKNEELFHFYHPVELALNEVFSIADRIFKDKKSFIEDSIELAKLLYEYSTHPKVKEGEFNVTYLSDVIIGGEIVDAIGLFKSETRVPFLEMNKQNVNFSISHQFGFEIKGADKGAIILNTAAKNGYVVMAVDNVNKSKDAQFWKDDFLKLKPINNEYQMTAGLMTIAKNFVTSRLPEEMNIGKAEQIDLLNRSVKYFKEHESYNKNEFEEEALKDENIIKSFRNFDREYRFENNIDYEDGFEISDSAVKKQSKQFRKVLKLDKNFHIYIHGDKEKIEKGREPDGRKYYKIYYENEE